ncbi:MAG: penicillin-binding protein 1C [Candidatus Eremiobacteraeota bacterium]|nr:penicillin-binding protein 1C [Candidatus Eremiobacteraeota bacterium]MBV8498651.1 penicillin-binding protein 1C [Candidatus Eremiobacteraeota bacterium]
MGFSLCVLAAIAALRCAGIDVARLDVPRESITYTDRNGGVLGTVLGADALHAVSVPLSSVSPQFLAAIVAAEDARFWHHGAVDVPALARAARDYAIFGEARSGGSTIEMQLARLLRGEPSTLRGKFAQIVTAQRIAIASSKDAVLEAYVNRVPMGGNVYGVEAAARTYFGEPASDLDLAQATLLAAVPNDPARLAPDADYHALRERQRFVLRRMVELGEITPARASRAFEETLAVRRHDFGIAGAAQALFLLYRQSAGRGRVRTTLDGDLQRFVQAQTEDVIAALQPYHVTDGAALVVDNRTGDVLAYVGSPDYFSVEALGSNDGVQALRQPGSSLKPFAYQLALERRSITPTTILADVPASYPMPGGGLYQPADYSGRFSGPVRVRYALANSLNAPAVQVLSRLGVGAFLDRLRELGFAHLTQPASFYGLGLTLGSGEVSLWELVQAYATIARDGVFEPLRLTAAGGAPARTVGDASDWQLITDMLADPHARAKSFGVGSVLQMPFPAAVKTGTSSDFRDTWTVGFTRDYTVGVWVGNFDGHAMRGVSGVTGAGPLWNRIMLHLYERRDEPPAFAPPRGFVRAAICATTGHAPAPSCPAVVEEWVRPQDLAAVRRAADPPREQYDAWLALRPPDESGGLRIVFPHDGDVFVRNNTGDATQSREQQIALRAVNSGGSLHWSVDGETLSLDSTGSAFWPLRLGTWRIDAADGTRRDHVSIRVVRPRPKEPGFTVLSH